MPTPATPTEVPALVTPAALLERLRWRYAVKRFDPSRTIPEPTWSALEEVLRLAPSSFGLQPWRFVVVRDQALRETLRAASWNQPQITEASHLVVFAARRGLGAPDVERLIDAIVDERGVTRESLAGYARSMLGFTQSGRDLDAWSARQTYLALGVFLEAAAMLGLDACPMEGIEPARYDEILGLSAQGYGALCVATAGYRSPDDAYARAKKVRYPLDEVVVRR
jgi:nitroreductase